jgi:hypothetical protein
LEAGDNIKRADIRNTEDIEAEANPIENFINPEAIEPSNELEVDPNGDPQLIHFFFDRTVGFQTQIFMDGIKSIAIRGNKHPGTKNIQQIITICALNEKRHIKIIGVLFIPYIPERDRFERMYDDIMC